MSETLVERLRKRAEIRRQIATRKSVQEGKADRISDVLEEAANRLETLARHARRWKSAAKMHRSVRRENAQDANEMRVTIEELENHVTRVEAELYNDRNEPARILYVAQRKRADAALAQVERLREALKKGRFSLATCMSPLSEWQDAGSFPEMVEAEAALKAMDAALAATEAKP